VHWKQDSGQQGINLEKKDKMYGGQNQFYDFAYFKMQLRQDIFQS
jgi:hypothetical protein